MLNEGVFLLSLLTSMSSISEVSKVSEEAKYASFDVQVNLEKYKSKSQICHQKMKDFVLSDKDKKQIQSLPKEAGVGLGKILDDALIQCSQPEIFNLASSLLLLQEQNVVEKSKEIEEQILVIRQLIFSKTSITTKLEYEKLPVKTKADLNEIDFLKKPFDLFRVIEGAWGVPQ